MSKAEHLDAIIIGTGQVGKPLAGALAEARWHTAIIERDRVGGTCGVRTVDLASVAADERGNIVVNDACETTADRVGGAAVLGVEGGEVVTVLQMTMMGGLPWTTLRDAVIAHPTFSESINNLLMTL